MRMWMSIVAVVVAWSVALLGLTVVRGKQVSRKFCILLLLCSSLGAGAVQYSLAAGFRRTERLSAARLVGVASLRVKDDLEFVRKHLHGALTKVEEELGEDSKVDWSGSFQMKARDVSSTIAALERNAFLQTNYSVWIGDIEFRRGQLESFAGRIAKLDEGKAREISVGSYLECLELMVAQLEELAHELRSRSPEEQYE